MRLWIDTNKARSPSALSDLCRLAQRKGVEVVVHAQVYLETRRQRRAKEGAKFNEQSFDGFLKNRITVFETVLDQRIAAAFADRLHDRYPTDDAWELAKKQTLGGELLAGFKIPPGAMPMTTDWLVALAVEADPDARIITHDQGEEWRHLREDEPKRALAWEEAIGWLESLPERLT